LLETRGEKPLFPCTENTILTEIHKFNDWTANIFAYIKKPKKSNHILKILISNVLNCETEVKHFGIATLNPDMAVNREQPS